MEGWLRGARMKTKGVTMREGGMSGEGVEGRRGICAREGCFEVGSGKRCLLGMLEILQTKPVKS
jgi:hypothetical protein